MDRALSTSSLDLAQNRNKVLRNTYNLLALSMLPTAAGAWLGMQMHFAGLFKGSPLMGPLLMLGVMVGLMFAIQRFRDSSTGVFLLLGFTFVMGLMLSVTLERTLRFSNGGTLIAMAAGGTAIIFFGMSALASSIKRDLSGMGKFLFIGTLLLIAASLANLFFQLPALHLALTVITCGLFSAWLLFDLNRIITGGETNYITATLSVYLDLYNIFASLLQILGIFGGDRD
ncbi:Bax inhibitor-1/YccA family protein [Uliginosibacterium sp. 31-16]|uniref:Bax inhibitor-1/YccA family protein n=1 Tax=Uliginosibacterium sp. 31-16 TaxID=3068315 RepID=UPI00273FD29B|nr:Bax inhibitor-1/YccA family protein [Uliginosibacterium sp. 31-16]MDP5241332.1 Bax inhibitor-1/YccA family protein [Uliginosibacterium sp. 31-16]